MRFRGRRNSGTPGRTAATYREKIRCKAELARGNLQVHETQVVGTKVCKDVNMVQGLRIWCMTGHPPCTHSYFCHAYQAPRTRSDTRPVQVVSGCVPSAHSCCMDSIHS